MKNLILKIFKIRVRFVLNMKTFKEERQEFYTVIGRVVHKKVIVLK